MPRPKSLRQIYILKRLNILSSSTTLFMLLVSVVISVCINIILIQAVKKRQYVHLSWIIPLASGYTLSTLDTVLYLSKPHYWFSLARSGSYPIVIISVLAGLIMIYGWIRLTVMFAKSDLFGRPLPCPNTINTDELPSGAMDGKDEVWPPPPVKPT